MNYEQALEYIHSRPRLKNTDNHKAMKMLLSYMGNPQDRLKYIHIAGTNGKGSCAAMCASVLKEAGYKVGLNISPFVIEFRERFQINGEYIPEEKLAKITEIVKIYSDQLEKEGLVLLEFEIVTAIAFYYFAQEKCDIVCLEVGIGGLLDSTNVINDSLVSCIMNISYDHTNILGNTLDEIAFQKAGIIKENCPVVCYPALEKTALATIMNVATKKNAKLIIPDIDDIKTTNVSFMKSVLKYGKFNVVQSFAGTHQSYNTSVVIETMKELRNQGYSISDASIINGIESTKFPARIEILSREPLVILDGGHNEDGVTALVNVLKENNLKNFTAIWSTLSDKNPEKIIQMMKPYISTLYTVPLDGNKRALTPSELAHLAKPYIDNVVIADSLSSAVLMAKEKSGAGLLIFGSLYLASEARKLLM